MASSWRDFLPKVLAEHEGLAVSAVNAVSDAAEPANAPKETNCTNCTDLLPAEVVVGLERLRSMAAPRGVKLQAWTETVADALRLADQGWASQALALGWTPLDLFGAVTDPDGDPAGDGLALKLEGRRVLAICEGFATVADAGDGRSYLHRGDTSPARLLWALDRDKETSK